MLETLQAIGVFLGAILLGLLFLPLWPFGIGAFIEWQRTPMGPNLDTPYAHAGA